MIMSHFHRILALGALALAAQPSKASGELWFPFAAIVCVAQDTRFAGLPGAKALLSTSSYQQWRESLGATNVSCIVSKQAASIELCTAVLSIDPTQNVSMQEISRLHGRLRLDIEKLEALRECQ
jgi:hypothetical protein